MKLLSILQHIVFTFCILPYVLVLSRNEEEIVLISPNENDYLKSIHRYETLNTQNLWFCRSLECLTSFSRNNAICHARQLILAGITYNVATDFMFPYFIPWLLHIFGDQQAYDVTVFIMDYQFYGETAGSDIINELASSMPSCTSFILFHCHALSISFHPKYLYEYRKALGYRKHVLIHLSNEVAYDIEQTTPTHTCYGNESSMLSFYQTYDLVIKQYYYLPFRHYSTYLPLGPQDYNYLVHYRKRFGIKTINKRSILCMFSGRFYYTTRTPEHQEREEIRQLMDESKFPCMIIPSQDDVLGSPQLSQESYISMMADTIFVPCPAGSAPETFRLYEALELGSIPVLVRPRDVVNFLNEWNDYPGPILSSWSQLNEYFQFLGTVDQNNSCKINDPGNDFYLCHDSTFLKFLTVESTWETSTMSRLHKYLNFVQSSIMEWYYSYKANVSSSLLMKSHNALFS